MIHLYRITNKINGKFYIGQTTYEVAQMRWATHKSAAKSGARGATKLLRAIRKYTPEAFLFEVIGGAFDQATADLMERFLIQSYDAIKTGYNLNEGGATGKHSAETKAKMSATRRANPQLSQTRLGDKASTETKAKMSAAQKRAGNRPPASTPESQAKATATRNAKFKGKPREWSVKREKPIFVDGFLYPSVNKAAECLDAEITTLHRNVRHSPNSKRKPKFACEWLCSPSENLPHTTETP